MTCLLPGITAKLAGKHAHEHPNLSLLLNCYIDKWEGAGNSWSLGERKKDYLDTICSKIKFDPQPLENYILRQKVAVESFGKDRYTVFPLKTAWRLVTGMGLPNPLESCMRLHSVFGFPIIPGTAVKGVTRAWVETEETFPDDAAKRRTLLEVFGSESKYERHGDSQVGAVVFYDALPSEFPSLGKDIVNVHYREYYGDGMDPGDWMEPVPNFFLSLPAETEFLFFMALRPDVKSTDSAELLQKVRGWLEKGLSKLGVGAKTNAGYGYFVVNEADTERIVTNGTPNVKREAAQTIPLGSSIATVLSVENNKVKVQIDSTGEETLCSKVTAAGLGLAAGSKIFVKLNRDKKTKLLQSAEFVKKV